MRVKQRISSEKCDSIMIGVREGRGGEGRGRGGGEEREGGR